MEKEIERRGWLKENGLREWTPPCCVHARSDGTAFGRPSVCVFVFVSRYRSELLLQEFAEQRVIELISPSSGANQQSFFSKTSEVFGLELWSELVNGEFAVAQFREFALAYPACLRVRESCLIRRRPIGTVVQD
jgi:hypothetical protein